MSKKPSHAACLYHLNLIFSANKISIVPKKKTVICLFRQKCSMKLENVQQDGSDFKDVPKSTDLETQDLNHFF